jgi:uncharacterized protein (TIGR02466 family)
MREDKLFYSPLWQEDLSTNGQWKAARDDMLRRIAELERTGKGVEKTNFGGWQSENDIYQYREMSWLLEQIMLLSNQVAPTFSPSFRFNNGTMWANINRRGHFNAVHTHPGALLSGVVYLKVESELQGTLQFFDCREGGPTTHWNGFTALPELTEFTEDVHSVAPREGAILFFPSWLRHWVTPNQTDIERISIAFNVRAT